MFNQDIKRIGFCCKYLEEDQSRDIVNILRNSLARVSNIKESQRSGKPPKPFKTTSLQTSSKNNLGFHRSFPKKHTVGDGLALLCCVLDVVFEPE